MRGKVAGWPPQRDQLGNAAGGPHAAAAGCARARCALTASIAAEMIQLSANMSHTSDRTVLDRSRRSCGRGRAEQKWAVSKS